MKNMVWIYGVLFVFCVSLRAPALFATENAPPVSQGELTKTRAIMDQIFASLTTVLPMSFDRSIYASTEHRAKISAELKNLNDSTNALSSHIQKFDGSFGFIAKSMAHDVKDVYRLFQQGSFTDSAYLLQQITENCTSCHMKLPDPGHAPKMDRFFNDVNVAKFSPAERARLQVALRQFDDALKTWEDMFAAANNPAELLVMDAMTEYLKVAIRVKSDPGRALKTLSSLSNRNNLPKFLVRETAAWIRSLKNLKPELKKTGSELKRAELILQSARKSMDYPMDRVGLVDYLVASTLLNRSINDHKTTPTERAEIYYYLGLTETLVGRNAWITQVAFYYEAAVRSAPGTKYATLALDGLEQQILTEYSGSGGIHIPDDIAANLEELRVLSRNSGPKRP